jgi:PleD family two-component response regulator
MERVLGAVMLPQASDMNENAEPVYEVLIVDDSATVVATAKKMLEDSYIVSTASNGQEAWDILQNNLAISMVFTDLQMPVVNGLELLLKIRNSKDSRLATMPVVIVTGKTDTAAGKQAVFNIGATDFIGKPFNALDLLTRARAHIDGKQINRRRRISDVVQVERDLLASPSAFHSIGCQALEYAIENKASFVVVYVELVNHSEIEDLVGDKNATAIFLQIAKGLSETTREEDVATRLGKNKLAVIYTLSGDTAGAVVDLLVEHMNGLVFEHDGKSLDVDIAYGYESSSAYGKSSTFTEICMRADEKLQISIGKVSESSSIRNMAPGLGESIFKGFKSRGKKIGLWFALKHVIDDDYEAIPDELEYELITNMKKYLEYVEGKT